MLVTLLLRIDVESFLQSFTRCLNDGRCDVFVPVFHCCLCCLESTVESTVGESIVVGSEEKGGSDRRTRGSAWWSLFLRGPESLRDCRWRGENGEGHQEPEIVVSASCDGVKIRDFEESLKPYITYLQSGYKKQACKAHILDKFKSFIYLLKGRVTRGKMRRRENVFYVLVHSSKGHSCQGLASQSQELGASSRLAT